MECSEPVAAIVSRKSRKWSGRAPTRPTLSVLGDGGSKSNTWSPTRTAQRHALAQAICTFKQGRIADRGVEAQQYRASGLNLIIAAIVYWNSTYLADAIAHLRAGGEILTDDQLAHT
jgi:Tn3 transposase DDE domain